MPVTHAEDVHFKIDKFGSRVTMTFTEPLTHEEKANIKHTLERHVSGASRVSSRGCLVIIAGLGPWGEGIASHLQEVFSKNFWPVALRAS